MHVRAAFAHPSPRDCSNAPDYQKYCDGALTADGKGIIPCSNDASCDVAISDSINPDDLHARGFKILLDILVRNPRMRRAEVPLRFGKRHTGASKGDSRQGMEYLRQLPRLRATATFARQANRRRREAVAGPATVISQS